MGVLQIIEETNCHVGDHHHQEGNRGRFYFISKRAILELVEDRLNGWMDNEGVLE